MAHHAKSKVHDHQSKGERTRAKLLKSAATEFAQLGYHNTKISNIVQRAGVSQPAFYLYFESKESAYEELVNEFRRRLQALTQTLLIVDELVGQQLVARASYSFRQFFDFFAEDPDLTEVGFFQAPACIETKAGLASWIAENIAKEQKNGLFRSDIPSTLIGSFFVGIIEQMVRNPIPTTENTELAYHCACILCEGIASK